MTEVQVNKSGIGVLDVEIRPDKNDRWFWIVWAGIGILILAFGWYQLGPIRLSILPLWLILWIFAAIVLVKGWQAWIWYSRGRERFRVAAGKLLYERVGSFLDRRSKQISATEITGFTVLPFGLGDSLEPSRLEIKTRIGKLYAGRNLSKDQACELKELLEHSLWGGSKHSMAT